MKNLVLLFLLALTACQPTSVKEDPFTADWESMKQFQVPDWFRDAKEPVQI